MDYILKDTMESGHIGYEEEEGAYNRNPWDMYGCKEGTEVYQSFQLEIVQHGVRCLQGLLSSSSRNHHALQSLMTSAWVWFHQDIRSDAHHRGVGWWTVTRFEGIPQAEPMKASDGGYDANGIEWQYSHMHGSYIAEDVLRRYSVAALGRIGWTMNSEFKHASTDALFENTLDRSANLFGRIQKGDIV